MQVVGLGIDIVNIKRIEKALSNNKPAYLLKKIGLVLKSDKVKLHFSHVYRDQEL